MTGRRSLFIGLSLFISTYARLRALEFRRWVVRSANNGISGIIAPDGSIKAETDYWKRTAFTYDVPVITEQTLYARFGDWLPIGLLVISVDRQAGCPRVRQESFRVSLVKIPENNICQNGNKIECCNNFNFCLLILTNKV